MSENIQRDRTYMLEKYTVKWIIRRIKTLSNSKQKVSECEEVSISNQKPEIQTIAEADRTVVVMQIIVRKIVRKIFWIDKNRNRVVIKTIVKCLVYCIISCKSGKELIVDDRDEENELYS